jgi:hypothetical protein
LIAGVDPFDLDGAGRALVARGRTFEMAIRQASERAFAYAHHVVHSLDQEPIDPALVDIWEMSDSFDRYLPSLELRNSVAAVLKDPENVPLLVPVDPWYSETVYGGEMRRWMLANDMLRPPHLPASFTRDVRADKMARAYAHVYDHYTGTVSGASAQWASSRAVLHSALGCWTGRLRSLRYPETGG